MRTAALQRCLTFSKPSRDSGENRHLATPAEILAWRGNRAVPFLLRLALLLPLKLLRCGLPLLFSGFMFQTSGCDFGVRVSGFGIQVSISGFGFRVSKFRSRFWVSGFVYRVWRLVQVFSWNC